MDLKFSEGDIINVYLKDVFKIKTIRFKVSSIIDKDIYDRCCICGYKLDCRDREIAMYYIRIFSDGSCEIGIDDTVPKYWLNCYLNKETAILEVEKTISEEFDRLKRRRAELLKFKFLEQ